MSERRRALAVATAAFVLLGATGPLLGVAAASGDGPVFEKTIVLVNRGEVAEVGIAVPAGDTVQVSIGSREANYLVRANVTDADGDGSVTLSLDTATAGSGDPSSSLSVGDGDELANASRETEAVEPPLDEAKYDLSLGPADDPAAVGTLVVDDPGESESGDEDGATSDADGATLVYEGEELTLENTGNATVRGETTLEPGTALTVRIRSTSEGQRFLRSNEVLVTEDGTFETAFNLTGVTPGATFSLVVRGAEGELVREDGYVVECIEDCPGSGERTTSVATETSPGGASPDGVGIGAIAAGGVLAVVGVALLLGVVRG